MSVPFEEEVYTSAASLLEGRGGANLGVVAKSRSFPREIEADMALLRGYTLLAGLAIDNAQEHPPRITLTGHGGDQSWLCLSHVVFAGADHTGRTTPLAHHMAFKVEELKAARISPAALLLSTQPLIYQRWEGPPRWIEPVRSVENVVSPEASGQFPAAAWDDLLDRQKRDLLLSAIAQHLIVFLETKRAVIVCHPVAEAKHVSRLMADILAFLPEQVQLRLVCASHVIDPGDAPADAALIFTYPGTRLLKQAQERRDVRSPVIFDLSEPNDAMLRSEGDYAWVTASVLRSGKAAAELPWIRQLWERLGLNAERACLFRQAILLNNRLQQVRAVGELDAVAAQVAVITAISSSAADCVEQWCVKYVMRSVQRWASDDRRRGLTVIAIDSRWPSALRQTAKEKLREQSEELVPLLIKDALSGAMEQANLTPLISELLADNPSLVELLIRKACSSGDQQDLKIALSALERSDAAVNAELHAWLDAVLAGNDGIRRELIAPILSRLKAIALNPAHASRLRDYYRRGSGLERPFLEEVYLPLLRHSLNRAKAPEIWNSLACQLVEASLDCGSESQEIAALAEMQGPRLDTAQAAEWVRQAVAESAQEPQRSARLERALQSSGLLKLARPASTRHFENSDANGTVPRRAPRRQVQQPLSSFTFVASIAFASVTVIVLALTAILLEWPAIGKEPNKVKMLFKALMQPSPIALLYWGAIAILVAWAIAEVYLFFMRLRLSTARTVRKAILTMLVIACVLSSYRLGNVWKPDRFKWFERGKTTNK